MKIWTVILALVGIDLIYELAKNYQNKDVLLYLDKHSMDIYLLHGPIMVGIRYILSKLAVNKIFISIILLGDINFPFNK